MGMTSSGAPTRSAAGAGTVDAARPPRPSPRSAASPSRPSRTATARGGVGAEHVHDVDLQHQRRVGRAGRVQGVAGGLHRAPAACVVLARAGHRPALARGGAAPPASTREHFPALDPDPAHRLAAGLCPCTLHRSCNPALQVLAGWSARSGDHPALLLGRAFGRCPGAFDGSTCAQSPACIAMARQRRASQWRSRWRRRRSRDSGRAQSAAKQ